jgi:hypothetical protein
VAQEDRPGTTDEAPVATERAISLLMSSGRKVKQHSRGIALYRELMRWLV